VGGGRLVAALTRRLGAGQLELVEGCVQEAMVRALERWPQDGVPGSVEGWLVRVAHNLAIDRLRREQRLVALPASLAAEAAPAAALPTVDDELGLMFLCCHPSLPRAAQAALTLKVACGFSARQIAAAFLSEEATVLQRLVRAKQQLRREQARLELPEADELPARLGPLLEVLYLMLNEPDFAGEALRLVRLLTALGRTATPATEALAALCCLLASRAPGRLADDGSLLLLAEQDRQRWDRALIDEGFVHLERAGRGDELTRFHLEAGIAACHAAAPSWNETDWPQILALYEALRARAPSPVVEVNRAVAVAMVRGALAGLDELDAIPERALVGRYPYALAAYAELHASLGHLDEARAYLTRALDCQPAAAQRALLERKRTALG
jgi:RNA polymerase sigma-70 factor (ECF subfamily)